MADLTQATGCCVYPHPVRTEAWDIATSSRVVKRSRLGIADR
jgi:hypothetical protein